MAELRVTDASRRRFHMAAAVLVSAAAMGTGYWLDRAHRLWWEAIHPLAEPRASLQRVKTGYHQRRASVVETAEFIRDLLKAAMPALTPPP